MPRNSLTTSTAIVAAVLLVALIGWRAGAESTEPAPFAQPTTVAIVDVEKAINNLDERLARNEAMGVKFQGVQQEIDDLQRQIENLEQEIAVLPDNAMEQRRDLIAQRVELSEIRKARFSVTQRLVDLDSGDILRDLYIKLLAATKEIAEQQGYDLVLFDDRTLDVPGPGAAADVAMINSVIQDKMILYAGPRLDITDSVIQLMNGKFQAGAD